MKIKFEEIQDKLLEKFHEIKIHSTLSTKVDDWELIPAFFTLIAHEEMDTSDIVRYGKVAYLLCVSNKITHEIKFYSVREFFPELFENKEQNERK